LTDRYADISRFLRARGHTSLYGYYGLAEAADPPSVEGAIDDKRRWAQTQQANQSTKEEARWLIQHHALIKRTLLQESEAYQDSLRLDAALRHEEHLRTFIRGAMHGGRFARAAEREVRKLARRLKVPDSFVEGLIVELIEETGASRASTTIDPETTRLMSRVQEVLTNGEMSGADLDALLRDGNKKAYEPKVIIRKIDDAVRERQMTTTAVHTERLRREEHRKVAITNLVEAVRGLYMARAFGPSTARAIEREALGQGLDLQTAERLTAEALSLQTRADRGDLDPWHVLGMGPAVPPERLRLAYTELRRMAMGKEDPARAASATMRLDLAWARLRR
jgi:hypothetical protein